MDFGVSDELGDGYPLVRCCRPLVSSLSLRSTLAPQASGPQPRLSATAAGLYQHLPNNKLIWLIRNRVTQLIELLFYNSRPEKTWDQTWASRFWEWRQQSTSLKKWFRPCIETDLRRLYSHTRALTCSGGLLTGGGGLALGEEVEVLLWVRRQTPWDKLHVTFLTLYSSRVSSTVTCGNDGHYFELWHYPVGNSAPKSLFNVIPLGRV